MTTVAILGFLLVSFMFIAILIKLGVIIFRAVTEDRSAYDGRDYFYDYDDVIDVSEDLLRYEPIEIEIIDRMVAYEQS